VRIKGRGSSTQRALCSTRLLRSLGRRNPVEDDGANLFIYPLFWRSTPLDQQMVVVGVFSAFSLGFWPTSAPGRRENAGNLPGFVAEIERSLFKLFSALFAFL
jgi:hypothetical protein